MARVTDISFFDAGPMGDPWLRTTRAVAVARFFVISGGIIAAFARPLGSPTDRLVFSLLVLLVFLPYSAYQAWSTDRDSHVRRVATVAADLAGVFIVAALFGDEFSAAASALAFATITAYAAILGQGAGFATAAIGYAGLLAADTLNPMPGFGLSAMVFSAVFLVAIVAIVRAAMAERTFESQLRVSSLSHELRTPLTSIMGFASLLTQGWERLDPQAQRDIADRIMRNCAQMRMMIDELSRRQDAAVPLPLVDEEIEPLVASFLRAHPHLSADHPVLLDIEPGLRARCDRDAMGHVLANLLSNAARYSPADAAITIRACARGSHVRISVEDHGAGIPRGEQRAIFDPYRRGASGARSPGSGIGLAIARRYVQAQRGRIWVDSEEGAGSTFHIELQGATPHLPETHGLAG